MFFIARILTLSLMILFSKTVAAQDLIPGFDKQEYISLMRISAQFGDSAYSSSMKPEGAKNLYRSSVTGFDNCWELWQDASGNQVISIRGTTPKAISWQANLFAAMVPATGELLLSEKDTFRYHLSADTNAAVHIGWLAATGFMAKDIVEKIQTAYKTGSRNFIIMGHSQGGAIAYLLTAYLLDLQKNGTLPADIRLKTYCSAAPKPGNLNFAYSYEALTYGGWSYNVVNALDWVPQTPITVQNLSDLPPINPFQDAGKLIKKQKCPQRWVFRYAYGRLTKPGKKAAKNYRKYLGDYVGKAVRKNLPGLSVPSFAPTQDYVRTGTTIVLMPDADYLRKFPQDKKNIFSNHFHPQYIYLAEKLP